MTSRVGVSIVCLVILFVSTTCSEIGAECDDTEIESRDICGAQSGMTCVAGRCICAHGHIPVQHFCFRVRNWGEQCYFSAQCTDHRLVCEDQGDGVSKCVCDKFHIWNSTFSACVQKYNISYMITMLEERYDTAGNIQKNSDAVFFGVIIAGFLVVFISIICFWAVIGYCYHIRSKDKQLHEILKRFSDIKKERDKEKDENKIETAVP